MLSPERSSTEPASGADVAANGRSMPVRERRKREDVDPSTRDIDAQCVA